MNMNMNLPTRSSTGDVFGQSWENSTAALMLTEQSALDLKATTSGIASLIDKHNASAIEIKADGDLSESGRRSKLVALILRSDKQLATLTDSIIAELQSETQTLSLALASASSVNPTPQEMMLIIERRAIAATFDQLEIESKLLLLAQDGTDDLSVVAIVTAPTLAPLARPEVCARARDFMGARALPDTAEALRQARESLAILRNAISTARHQFASPVERGSLGIDATSLAASGNSAALAA